MTTCKVASSNTHKHLNNIVTIKILALDQAEKFHVVLPVFDNMATTCECMPKETVTLLSCTAVDTWLVTSSLVFTWLFLVTSATNLFEPDW